jgi:hypothetical protein
MNLMQFQSGLMAQSERELIEMAGEDDPGYAPVRYQPLPKAAGIGIALALLALSAALACRALFGHDAVAALFAMLFAISCAVWWLDGRDSVDDVRARDAIAKAYGITVVRDDGQSGLSYLAPGEHLLRGGHVERSHDGTHRAWLLDEQGAGIVPRGFGKDGTYLTPNRTEMSDAAI